MKRKLRALVPIGAAALALATGIATAGSGPITISYPRTGQLYSAKKTADLVAAGNVAFATPVASTTKFYLRRDGCGGKDANTGAAVASDNPRLSTTAGTKDGGNGCGFIGGNGVAAQAAPGIFSTDFPSVDGMPLNLDASRDITGTLDLLNSTGGAGQVTLDFVVEALYKGDGVPVGSTSVNVLVTPTDKEIPVNFTISPSMTLDRAALSGLDLHVYMHGAYSESGYIGLNGKSSLSVPGWTASFARSVLVSVDDPSFASPTTAGLNNASTAWAASTPLPKTPGNHTVYARAVQGFNTLGTTSTVIRVTK